MQKAIYAHYIAGYELPENGAAKSHNSNAIRNLLDVFRFGVIYLKMQPGGSLD